MSTEQLTPSENSQISEALKQEMQQARDYQQLTTSWQKLNQEWALQYPSKNEASALEKSLTLISICFCKTDGHNACDSGAKQIWNNPDALQQLKNSGIPLTFILQSVRIGAIREQEALISQTLEPVSDGREINGFNWANEQLVILKQEAESQQKQAETQAEIQLQTQTEAVFTFLQAGQELTAEQKKLIRPEIEKALRYWKASSEKFSRWTEVQDFLSSHGDRPLTVQLAREFQQIIQNRANSRQRDVYKTMAKNLEFRLINPDSAWFKVLEINGQSTLREFINAANSNMDSWFVLSESDRRF